MKSRCIRRSTTRSDGFTIIELLAVVTIIALLGALVVGLARFASEKSAEAQVRADLEKLKSAIEEHRLQTAGYPTFNPVGNFHPMVEPPDPFPGTPTPMERFTKALEDIDPELNFTDPWRTNYFYRARDAFRFEVRSAGQDRIVENEDDIY